MASPPLAAPAVTPRAHEAAAGVRRVLLDLGADADLARRVGVRWDVTGGQHVYVPPLPVALAEHLARVLPAGAGS